MRGWRSVEELTRWGFSQSPVVMANEAHNGLTRCIRTREVGIRIVQAAHQAGVRRLAMEALPLDDADAPGPFRAMPPVSRGYLAQPDMRRLITTALDLGWSLWAYEAVIESGRDQSELLSLEFTNWREAEQARNLCRLIADAPADPLLVWCGNAHASKQPIDDWIPMGYHFSVQSGIEPFVIDHTVTIDFTGAGLGPWAQQLLSDLGETLAPGGGSMGILRGQAPKPLDCYPPGVDALVISTENTMT
jgi:hypothetical protein